MAGTTGYDFLNAVDGLFVDPAGLEELVNALWPLRRRAAQISAKWPTRRKRLILRTAMASDLQLLAHRFNRISERHRRSRDFTFNTLRTALREILACFPVYRTYIRRVRFPSTTGGLFAARRRRPNVATRPPTPAVFDFIRDVLLLERRRIWTRPAAKSGNCSSAASNRSPVR